MSDAPLRRALDLVLRDRHDPANQVAVVLSPPGAGKTELALAAAVAATAHGLRAVVACPRAGQAVDVARRLLRHYPGQPVRLALGKDSRLPGDLRASARQLRPGAWARDGTESEPIEAATVGKLAVAVAAGGPYDLLVCDEAFQVAYADLFPLPEAADRFLLVGDPGQLPPLVEIDPAPFAYGRCDPTAAAPAEVLRLRPAAPVIRQAATRRLPPDSAAIVQRAFYPDLPFGSGADPAARRLRFRRPSAGDPVDRALDLIAGGASLVALALPPRAEPAGPVDGEAVDLMARVVERVLAQGPVDATGSPLATAHLCCLDPHNASGAALRRALGAGPRGVGAVHVSTPERFQGLERPVAVARLADAAGEPDPGFALDPGRLCVSLSRHTHAGALVVREGELPDERDHDCGARPIGKPDRTWAGVRAIASVRQDLERRSLVVRA